MLGFTGVIAIDTSRAGVTVSVVEPLAAPVAAVIVVMPVPTLLASPLLSGPLLTVATVASAELQCTVAVRSCVVWSVKVPVAVNCCPVPSGIEGTAGVMAMDANCAAETVSVADPIIELYVAEIVVVPTATLVARPVPEILAMLINDESQVTDEVRSCVLPSL